MLKMWNNVCAMWIYEISESNAIASNQVIENSLFSISVFHSARLYATGRCWVHWQSCDSLRLGSTEVRWRCSIGAARSPSKLKMYLFSKFIYIYGKEIFISSLFLRPSINWIFTTCYKNNGEKKRRLRKVNFPIVRHRCSFLPSLVDFPIQISPFLFILTSWASLEEKSRIRAVWRWKRGRFRNHETISQLFSYFSLSDFPTFAINSPRII